MLMTRTLMPTGAVSVHSYTHELAIVVNRPQYCNLLEDLLSTLMLAQERAGTGQRGLLSCGM
jgi:hypothetical protein